VQAPFSGTGHSLGQFVHHVVLFPWEAKIEPKFGKSVIRSDDKTEPSFRSLQIFSTVAVLGELLGRLIIGKRPTMNCEAGIILVERLAHHPFCKFFAGLSSPLGRPEC
jgi:hypothetical protein